MTMVLAPHRGAKTRARAAEQAGGTSVTPRADAEAAAGSAVIGVPPMTSTRPTRG